MWLKIAQVFAALLFWSASALAPAQTTPPPADSAVKGQLFGGMIVALNDKQITVSRTAIGKAPERRTFLINAKTKMNRSVLKLRAKVTVLYRRGNEGNIALEIQLQPARRVRRSS